MGKRRKREPPPERDEYRKGFAVRLVEKYGDVSQVARAAQADPATVWSWRQPGEGLPDVFQIVQIARERKLSPAWLAFGMGPRDPTVAESGFGLSAQVERYSGLKDVIHAYCVGGEEDRAAIRWAASKVRLPVLAEAVPAQYAGRIVPLEARPVAASRREELAVFTVSKRRKGALAPHWLDLAAGAGGPLERCKDYLYFQELPDWQGIHSARIRGESMKDTLRSGDIVVLRAMGESGLKLPALASGAEKNPFARLRVDVPDDSIWVLSINAEEPTLKRVRYFVSGADWHLMVQADNPLEPGYPRVVTRHDEVTFWARVIGIAQEG